MQVIEAAQLEDLPKGLRKELKRIVKHCTPCQLKQKKPRRFLYSMHEPIIEELNNTLQVDVVKLSDGYVVHVVGVGTKFQNGSFTNRMDAKTAWWMLRNCWIDVYAGAPDYVYAHAGTNFDSDEFKENARRIGNFLRIALTEGHERIDMVEWSHAQLRAVYDDLKMELKLLSRETRLAMSFRSINVIPSSRTAVSPTN